MTRPESAGSAGLEVADVLERAAELLSAPGAWGQNSFAYDANGLEVDATSFVAFCWCVRGAAYHVCNTDMIDEAEVFSPLREVLGLSLESLEEWNDAPERTQAEVVAKLREAAALSRAGKSS